MLDKPASALRLRERLLDSERLMEETGCYDGITELQLRNQDPLKFETLHTKLRAYCVSAREMARRISASPGVREAYIGGRWHKANLYEMDLLQPGHEVIGPAIIEHPATTLVVHPQDRVHVDEWTLLHYTHA